ncbi:Zinc/iron permease [Saccharata proteae CBS 121410]|uniref:Zinc/iron permease n=1 Tax=Saccharata proteae CBS 121410 TaxID=1314787 RepID=A0A9P4HQG4_9PEZI|nr:Zinc/iron permease [Saccharata proteae CBS 121410]
MVLDNDTRGWIMTAMSGIASIICVDVIVRLIPGKKDFRIQDSNAFLSSSLSLSFGVMLFSSLYSMLPSAKSSLIKGGFSPKAAAWTLIACFIGGVIGIQIVSRVMHHFIPSHVVDCDHSHDEEAPQDASHDPDKSRYAVGLRGSRSMTTDLATSQHSIDSSDAHGSQRKRPAGASRRPSFPAQLTHKVSQIMTGSKAQCDEVGPCYGYSDPCGQECFKIVQSRSGRSLPGSKAPGMLRSVTTPHPNGLFGSRQTLLQEVDEETPLAACKSGPPDVDYTNMSQSGYGGTMRSASLASYHDSEDEDHGHHENLSHSQHHHHADPAAADSHHHHHVPTNAFLSIGLQTSIAIALHKLPEGFITYATNHANPSLGFAVFLALFIHNITEGFAMALPLYLAVNSRWKAMFWSSLLGGASQPAGAGVAALWFRWWGNEGEPGEGVYGGMFAVTAGIMASVALQLFQQSMDLTHNKNLCIVFAFAGMTILGISSALTA